MSLSWWTSSTISSTPFLRRRATAASRRDWAQNAPPPPPRPPSSTCALASGLVSSTRTRPARITNSRSEGSPWRITICPGTKTRSEACSISSSRCSLEGGRGEGPPAGAAGGAAGRVGEPHDGEVPPAERGGERLEPRLAVAVEQLAVHDRQVG